MLCVLKNYICPDGQIARMAQAISIAAIAEAVEGTL